MLVGWCRIHGCSCGGVWETRCGVVDGYARLRREGAREGRGADDGVGAGECVEDGFGGFAGLVVLFSGGGGEFAGLTGDGGRDKGA